jgi:hypothetical protein
MSSFVVAFVIVISCCVSATIGIALHSWLPDDHLDSDSRDVVKLVMGVIATMVALVLGLLIASAKSTYDVQSAEIEKLAADIVQLDRILMVYGPDTRDARNLLRQSVAAAHDRIWPADDYHQAANLDPSVSRRDVMTFYGMVENLSPTTDSQRHAQSTALALVGGLAQTRLLMFEQISGSVSLPLLVVLISWISVLFVGFGLFARAHITIAATILVGALSVASAVFLILELSQPYQGFMRIPDTSVRLALEQIAK